jgi:hypothetical protein
MKKQVAEVSGPKQSKPAAKEGNFKVFPESFHYAAFSPILLGLFSVFGQKKASTISR